MIEQSSDGTAEPPSPAPVLSVADLNISLGSGAAATPIVTALNFEVGPGEAVALVGESGCGKSMTARAIAGLPPDGVVVTGSIKLLGRELTTLPVNERRRLGGAAIGFIFQEPMTALHPTIPLGRQMTDALCLHFGISRKQARSEAAGLLLRVGIPPERNVLDAYVHQLSGGMRQRVMIAMAVSCKPKLVIADEPTTALDVTIQAQVLELLAEMRRELGIAMLYITHDLDVVSDFCERAIVLYSGDMVEAGPAMACLKQPRHPYTRGLVDAIPSFDEKRTRLTAIPGTVPALGRWPVGCRFAPRCERASSACEQRPSFTYEADAGYRCWHPIESQL